MAESPQPPDDVVAALMARIEALERARNAPGQDAVRAHGRRGRPSSATPLPTAATRAWDPDRPRLRRAILGGVRRSDATVAVESLLGRLADAVAQIDHLSEELAARDGELADAQAQLEVSRARVTQLEAELGEYEGRAERIEQQARERAAEIERAADERARHIFDRAADEASTILRHARSESSSASQRSQAELEHAQQRVERMAGFQLEMTEAVRGAIRRFEQGLLELESTAPTPPQVPVIPFRPVAAGEDEVAERPALQAIEGGAQGVREPEPPRAEAVEREIEPGAGPERAPLAEAQPPEPLDPDAVLSPSVCVLEVHPLNDFPALSRFEKAVAGLDVVQDVYVLSYENAVAEFEISLARPSPLGELLRRRLEYRLEVDDDQPHRLRVEVHDEPESHRRTNPAG